MEKTISVDEGAEAFVELLNANGVEYIFLNPRTATFPIQEALSKFKALGKRTPEVRLSLHESVGINLVPSPNYALIAQACHIYVQMVEDPSTIQSALKDAIAQVHRDKPAVLDVRIESPQSPLFFTKEAIQ